MCMKEDNPGPNYFKGDNKYCGTTGYPIVIWLTVLVTTDGAVHRLDGTTNITCLHGTLKKEELQVSLVHVCCTLSISESHPHEQYQTQKYMCTYFRSKFEHKDFNFGPDENVTFYVYVYNFTTPFWLQVRTIPSFHLRDNSVHLHECSPFWACIFFLLL